MKSPTNPTKACQDCGTTAQVFILKSSGAHGYKGYHCPPCLSANLVALQTSYKYTVITVTNTEAN